MTKITPRLKKIFETPDETNDPFSFSFDLENIKKSEEWDEVEVALLEIIESLHALFLQTGYETRALISSSLYSYQQIYEELMVMGNRHILLLFQRIEQHYNDQSLGMLDFERLRDVQIPNGMGKMENPQDSSEMLIDLYSLLISYQKRYGWLEVDADKKEADRGYSREEIVQRLVLFINIVFNAKIAFQSIVFSELEVHRNEDESINIGPDAVSFITAANEIRIIGRVNELLFPLLNIMGKRKVRARIIDHVIIKDDEFSLILRDDEITLVGEVHLISRMAVFYPYLDNIKLSYFKGAMLFDLLKLLQRLSDIVDFFRYKYYKEDLDTVNPPFRIRKESLYSYLCETADIGKDIVTIFLDSLIYRGNETLDLYRYPLIEETLHFILCFPAINAPSPHPFVTRWLDSSGIDDQERSILFRNYVKNDLASEKVGKRSKFKWKIIESEEFPDLLAIETRDFFVAVDFLCPGYTINQAEERQLLKGYDRLYADRAQRVSDFADKNNVNIKRLLKICLTSDIHYSGLDVSGIPILDLILLKNYLIVGRYQKIKMINDELNGVIKDLYDLPYYLDQEEFESSLPNFMVSPIPIRVLTSKMKQKSIPLFPEALGFSIIQTTSELITEDEEEQLDLSDLDGMLKSQYFLNEENPLADRAINSLISKIFSKVADTQRGNLQVVETLITSIKTSKRISSAHLVTYITMMMARMRNISIVPDQNYTPFRHNVEEIDSLIEKCLPKGKGNQLQMSNFRLDHSMSEDERKQISSFLFDLFGRLTYREFNIEEYTDIYVQLIILGALIKDDAEYNRFFLVIGNFVENLNLNQHYQIARDIAQECWIYAAGRNRNIQGLNILFRCFIKQKNILYSAVFGALLMAAIDSAPRIEKAIYGDILFNLLRFFREFRYNELAKSAWKMSRALKLGGYDDQKFTIAYFNTRLSLGLKNEKELQGAVVKYLKKNFKGIVSYGDMSIGPWLALCMNLRRHCLLMNIPVNNQIISFLEKFEGQIDDEKIILNLKFQIEGNSEDSDKEFIRALERVFRTEYFDDYKYEVINLRPIADNMFVRALDKVDNDLLLLTSLVYNDQRLHFVDIKPEGGIKPFASGRSSVEIFSKYFEHIISGLALSDRQILIWLVELNANVYRIVITAKDEIETAFLPNWNPHLMDKWVREVLPKFYFNSQRNKYYDFNEQENVSNSLVTSLANYDLHVCVPFSEILVLKSVDMSSYPDNLLIDKGQLVSSRIPICNILNLEHFISNHSRIDLTLETVNAWLPKEGKDATISFGHDEMRPFLEEQGAEILDQKIINKMPPGDINIFLAHGTTDLDGFKYFQADDKSFHFRTDIFGQGTVAILFICSSGNLHEDFQSQDVRSIGQDLILQGYSAVIAPFWKYDVTMAKIWLREFFKVFKEGYSISESVHLSNRKVTEYDEETGRMFVEPAGWAAMHLYGNPNVYYSNTSVDGL